MTDLRNMVLGGPTKGEGSLPTPPLTLRKFAEESRSREASSAMEEEDEREAVDTSPSQRLLDHQYLDHQCPHDWTKDKSEIDEQGHHTDGLDE